VNTKQHTSESSQNNWMDPLYLNELLTEEEKAVKKTTKDYCKSKLLPKVIENNKKCFVVMNINNYLIFCLFLVPYFINS